MLKIYEICAAKNKPVVLHAGRAPASPGYKCNPNEICSVDNIEHVLKIFPTLKLCVPHMGADEYEGYYSLLQKYDNLYLDTTCVLAGIIELYDADLIKRMILSHSHRIMYGTDFPSIKKFSAPPLIFFHKMKRYSS